MTATKPPKTKKTSSPAQRAPMPLRKFIGAIADGERVLVGAGLRPKDA